MNNGHSMADDSLCVADTAFKWSAASSTPTSKAFELSDGSSVACFKYSKKEGISWKYSVDTDNCAVDTAFFWKTVGPGNNGKDLELIGGEYAACFKFSKTDNLSWKYAFSDESNCNSDTSYKRELASDGKTHCYKHSIADRLEFRYPRTDYLCLR